LGTRNFLNSVFTIISVSDVPRGGVQVLFTHQKQHSPPLGSSLPRVFGHWPAYPTDGKINKKTLNITNECCPSISATKLWSCIVFLQGFISLSLVLGCKKIALDFT